VFMDWNMPGLDGWQTSQLIRESHGLRQAPIIIMVSAHGREALATRLRDEPAVLNGFLVKPVTASMLFDAVADARAGDASANAVALPRPAVARPPTARLAGLRLLLVEDNLLNQQVALELLSHEGAIVTVASAGHAGATAALTARPPFDAVLMDIQMPDIDGYAATALIRRRADMASLPIIAMTANVLAEDKAACLAAGMDDHVGKPIDLDVLVATVLRHVARTGADHSATPPIAWKPPPFAAASYAASIDQDFDTALRQIGGSTALFLKMTAMFVRDTSALAADLQRQVLGEDKEAAVRLLHTLKGTAGTVGATALADYARRTEQRLRLTASTRSMPFSAEEFATCIRQSCQALQAYADGLAAKATVAGDAGAALDKPAIARLLDQLDALMRTRNMRALAMLDELRAAYGTASADRLDALERSMNDLDFPSSLECTRTLRAALA